MKLAGTVILYHPEEKVLKNIQSYLEQIEKLYVIDNTENSQIELIKDILQLPKVTFLHDGINKGIAARLNQVCDRALEDGYEWLLTMDQDSRFEEGGFAKYLEYFADYRKKEDVAVFGVNFLKDIFPVSDVPAEVLSTITSGSLINLNLCKIIGKYNEDLFIDFVDAEYCYRANALNYKVIQFRNIILIHHIGYIQYGRSLKNFKLTPRVLHSPVRIYYIVRNGFYMLYKFPNLPEGAKKEIKTTLSLLKNNIIYHKERLQVLKYIIKGYIDFKKNKMGKLQSS
jgi:rhamnosyltransferase